MEKISRADRVKNEVLCRVKEERSTPRTIERRKANTIGHILHGNCLLKHVIEGRIEAGTKTKGGEEEDGSSY
jgi:hypothetical protein